MPVLCIELTAVKIIPFLLASQPPNIRGCHYVQGPKP